MLRLHLAHNNCLMLNFNVKYNFYQKLGYQIYKTVNVNI